MCQEALATHPMSIDREPTISTCKINLVIVLRARDSGEHRKWSSKAHAVATFEEADISPLIAERASTSFDGSTVHTVVSESELTLSICSNSSSVLCSDEQPSLSCFAIDRDNQVLHFLARTTQKEQTNPSQTKMIQSALHITKHHPRASIHRSRYGVLRPCRTDISPLTYHFSPYFSRYCANENPRD